MCLCSRTDAHLKDLYLQESPGSLETTCDKDISEGDHGEAEITIGMARVALNFLFYYLHQNPKSLLIYATSFKGKKNQLEGEEMHLPYSNLPSIMVRRKKSTMSQNLQNSSEANMEIYL